MLIALVYTLGFPAVHPVIQERFLSQAAKLLNGGDSRARVDAQLFCVLSVNLDTVLP